MKKINIKNKEKTIKISILIALIVGYVYFLAIENMPNSIVVFEGEKVSINAGFLGFRTNPKDETIETISNNNEQTFNQTGKTTLEVSLFNTLPVKEVNVDVLPKTTVIPVGKVAGLKLYTEGVLVVGMSEITGADNKIYKPYENTGIEEGDTIVSINGVNVSSTEDLTKKVNESNGSNLSLKYLHDEETLQCSITPVKTDSNQYKLGLWVRDSAAGVGTVTFYEPSTNTFGALGHGITDIDTEELISISSGEFITTNILNITKGESGNPGRIQGTIDKQKNIGSIYKNTKFGIYGKVDNVSNLDLNSSKEMEVALRDEIQTGKATILCGLNNHSVSEYEIEIEEIYKNNDYDNKSMKIKVTDEKLLEISGGIIQGMSGAPIIQNGKFIGAVTNVLVSNPQEGYGVFGDIMLKQAKDVN